MNNNQTLEQKLHLIMSAGALIALVGAAIVLIYFDLLPRSIPDFNVPNWVIGILGVTWFFSGVGAVAFAAIHVKK